MLKNKRQRAVVLALIAFFCTAATTYVAVDWKRFGGGFLAFFRGKGDPAVASTITSDGNGSSGGRKAAVDKADDRGGSLPKLVATNSHRRMADGSHGAGGGHKSEEDLFKYGDPAAGGIPPGSFIVAQNENNGGGGSAEPFVPVTPQVTEPAPTPGGEPGPSPAGGPISSPPGVGDTGLPVKTPASPSAPTPPVPNPPAPNPPASTPTTPNPPVESPPTAPPPSTVPDPIQSGTSGETPPPPPSSGPPSIPPIDSPVPSIPEAPAGSMMALGALFLAVAARQRRKS